MTRVGTLIVLVVVASTLFIGTATAAPNCTRYRNHSGHIPAQYDYGYGEEWNRGELIDTFNVPGGTNAGRPSNGGTWDYVWKCYNPTTTTTTAPTTTTVPETTTTTVIDTTTTTVPETTTTTTEATTTTTQPEVTTTTEPEVTSTTQATTTTTTEAVTTTTTVDPCKTGATPLDPKICPPELPMTGPSDLIPFGIAGTLLAALGTGLVYATTSKERK